MSESSRAKKQFQLFTKPSGNGKQQRVFEVTPGRGDEGNPLRIQAESDTRYELFDREIQRARAERSGRNLEIYFDGSTTTPAGAVAEDSLTLVVTPADNGTPITLTHVLSADDIASGSISHTYSANVQNARACDMRNNSTKALKLLIDQAILQSNILVV